MTNNTIYIIQNHLYWIDNKISKDEIQKTKSKLRNENPFTCIKIDQIKQTLGYKLRHKDFFSAEDYEKITFLDLNLSRTAIDLDFVKYCINLEEIYISGFKVENLDFLEHNIKLKKIIANNNNISNIEALKFHNELEILNIENNPSCSLKPIFNLKKIKKLEIGLIDTEIHVLNILKNNPICELKYIIEGGVTNFKKFIFPYYQLIISKNEIQININIEGVEDTSSFPIETRIPENLLENKEYSEKIKNNLVKDISNRLEIILDKPFSFDDNNSYTFGYSYHLGYTYKL